MTLRKQVLVFAVIVVYGLPLFSQSIHIGGSDTLIFLGQRFTEQYRTKHFGAQFAIGGTASNKTADLDIVQGEGAGSAPRRVAFPVAIHGIVVYVNKSNPVRELTLAQVRSIFLGQITNWKELGGPYHRINLFAGESTTGTLVFFQEVVLRGEEPYPFEGKSNTHALLEKIASDPAAIGYGTLDANPGVHAVALKIGPASMAVEPTISTIRSKEYPLTRQVYWAESSSASREAKEFCAWVLSAEGQLVAEGAGFQPLLPQERSAGLSRLGLVDAPRAVARAH